MDGMFTTKTQRHKDFLVILRVLVPLWSACRVNGVTPVNEPKWWQRWTSPHPPTGRGPGGRGIGVNLRRGRLEIAPVGAERCSAPGRPPVRTEASTPGGGRDEVESNRVEL